MSEAAVTYSVLVFASGEAVAGEIKDAVRKSADAVIHTHLATDLTQAIDIARAREPQAALIELSGDRSTDRNRIGELKAAASEMVLAAVFSADAVDSRITQEYMVDLVRLGVNDFLRRPLAVAEINGFFSRLQPTSLPSEASRMATCLAFISNKGGVGKSTLAVNLASSLALRYPDDVLLIDTSLQMGVCAPMLKLTPETTLLDAIDQRQRLDQTLIRQLATPHESGLLLLAAPPDPLAATDIDDQSIARVLNLARRTFQFVIVDTFPLFDQIVMSVLDITNRAYVVLDNVVPSVLSAVQLLRLLENLQYPRDRIRIVVNRYQHLPGNPLLEDIARSLRMEVTHVVPYDKRCVTAANVGRPCALDVVRWSKLHRALAQIRDEAIQLAGAQGGTEDE